MRLLTPLLLVLLVTAACQKPGNRVIGVVPKGANHIFWLTVKAGAEKAAAEAGYQVEWNAPALEIDAKRQQDIIESMVNRRLAGIAFAPVDKKALVGVVDRAHAAAIPTVIYDSDVDTPNRLSYIATDNREGGRLAARRIGALLNGKGKVGVIGFMPGSASTMEREDGFTTELKAKFPAITLVGLQFGMADRAKAMAVTENMLTAHPDLAGLFADNESSLSGAVQALKSRNARSVKLVGFDASDALIADVKEGWIDSLVLQDPFRMGYDSVQTITRKLSGQNPAARIDLPATLATRDDLAAGRVAKQLLPGFVAVSGAH
ncbi:MAG TPA: substrate-binding domain-containing protein [Bryobacteraceae bacterium]|nr:substrate-binding domain-containing protein [Bryobacteraceae bacterium]